MSRELQPWSQYNPVLPHALQDAASHSQTRLTERIQVLVVVQMGIFSGAGFVAFALTRNLLVLAAAIVWPLLVPLYIALYRALTTDTQRIDEVAGRLAERFLDRLDKPESLEQTFTYDELLTGTLTTLRRRRILIGRQIEECKKVLEWCDTELSGLQDLRGLSRLRRRKHREAVETNKTKHVALLQAFQSQYELVDKAVHEEESHSPR
jgi:hypothetical protein